MTKPSRSASKGRLALVGSSFRVDIAFMEQKPAIAIGVTVASVPPEMMTSASLCCRVRRASPIALADDVQADTVVKFGPLAPRLIEIWPEAMLLIIIGMKKG